MSPLGFNNASYKFVQVMLVFIVAVSAQLQIALVQPCVEPARHPRYAIAHSTCCCKQASNMADSEKSEVDGAGISKKYS